jgi:hypothetical protein
MEVSTINWSDLWPEMVGLSRRHHECVWLGDGDYGHTMLDPFLEMYRMEGYQPAWEMAQATADAMARQRTGSWRYLSNPIAGLSRMYLETQKPEYLKQANRIWDDLCYPDKNTWWLTDHGNRAVLYYSQINPQCEEIWKQWTLKKPGAFMGLDVLSALYLKTADPKYAIAVAIGIEKSPELLPSFPGSRQSEMSKTDPMLWGIGTITQHILVQLRELCYAGSTAEAGKPLLKDEDVSSIKSDKATKSQERPSDD